MNIPDSHQGIVHLLKKAGDSIMDIYQSGDFRTAIKKDNSPVTAADVISEKIIIEGLQHITPGIPVVGEEKYSRSEVQYFPPTCWIVDPLDGTKEFIKRNDEFAICLALMKNSVIEEGYIYAPTTATLWFAIKGKGAAKSEKGRSVSLPSGASDEEYILLMSRSHHSYTDREQIKNIKKRIPLKEVYQGSAIKFGRLAEGTGDLYLKNSSLSIWDIAAGTLILTESGGGVISLKTGKPISFCSGLIAADPFMAYGRRINDPALLADIKHLS